MKGKVLSAMFMFAMIVVCGFSMSACGVVPCAWVKLDMEGYVYYTTDMYGSSRGHIGLYESKEAYDADTWGVDYLLTVSFMPRILGPDDVDGERVTTVDIGQKYCEMDVTINKRNGYYDAAKKVYLNDTALTPTSTYDYEYYIKYTFEKFSPVRGNPNGQFNHFINKIAYR